MARRIIQATKVSKHDKAVSEIEDLRHGLPVNMYLGLLHSAATLGQMPEYDEKGILIGVRQVTQNQQLDAAKYLIDKAMPNKAPVHIEATPELASEQAITNPRDLSIDQLNRLADNSQTDPDDTPEVADVFSVPNQTF